MHACNLNLQMRGGEGTAKKPASRENECEETQRNQNPHAAFSIPNATARRIHSIQRAFGWFASQARGLSHVGRTRNYHMLSGSLGLLVPSSFRLAKSSEY